MPSGRVKAWNQARAFGFIAQSDGEPDVFVHVSRLPVGVEFLSVGQTVTFDVRLSARTGKDEAVNVRLSDG